MNDQDLKIKVQSSLNHQLQTSGCATPIQTLLDLNILSKEDYERWRTGKVDYLERVCHTNLRKLTTISNAIREYAKDHKLKESYTVYKQWGTKNKNRKLRFSKSGNETIERKYATHYIRNKENGMADIC